MDRNIQSNTVINNFKTNCTCLCYCCWSADDAAGNGFLL